MPPTVDVRLPLAAAMLLGFALGGFFDGILLHQVLQWHHLLSNVESVRELRTQLMADGLFHVLMYVLALLALLRLRRAWGAVDGSGHALTIQALYGFALWQAVDIVLFHWMAGIHRVRVDVPNPLAWDIAWLVVFGVPPLLAARWLRNKPGHSGGRGVAAALALTVLAGGIWSGWPNQLAQRDTVVLFAPGVTAARAFDALSRLDARVRWVDPGGGVWAVQWARPPGTFELLREGALLVSGTPLGLGCVGWSSVAAAAR